MKTVYFLGIGGIGMSALARYYAAEGARIFGYDRTRSELTHHLENEGMHIHYNENIDALPEEIDLVVYTPAVPSDHKEYIYLQKTGIPIKKRSEVLGMLSKQYKTIAVAGTHGKTTTSTLAAHLMRQSNVDCQAFLGGIAKNYESNLLLSKHSEFMVTEADEFDRSFLQLHPHIAVITSVDADHLDIYQNKKTFVDTFSQFTGNIRENGFLLIKKGVDLGPAENSKYTIFQYADNTKADFYATGIRLVDQKYHFTLIHPKGEIHDLVLGVPGRYNIENAVAASACALLCGVSENELREGLKTFAGVHRRFDIRVQTEKLVYIDDYAHHPEELKACITSTREMYPNRKITGIFQPHLYTRTRDFADEFGQSLSLLDEVILLPIYPARELPIEGITSEMLLEKIVTNNKTLVEKKDLVNYLKNKELDVLLTLGAGDIDTLVAPIENELQKRNK